MAVTSRAMLAIEQQVGIRPGEGPLLCTPQRGRGLLKGAVSPCSLIDAAGEGLEAMRQALTQDAHALAEYYTKAGPIRCGQIGLMR